MRLSKWSKSILTGSKLLYTANDVCCLLDIYFKIVNLPDYSLRLTSIRNLPVGTTVDVVAGSSNARCAFGKVVDQNEDWNSIIQCSPKSLKSSSFGKKVLIEIMGVKNSSLIVPDSSMGSRLV